MSPFATPLASHTDRAPLPVAKIHPLRFSRGSPLKAWHLIGFLSYSCRHVSRAVVHDRISSSANSSRTAVMGQIKHSMTQDILLFLNQKERYLPRLADGSIVGDMEQLANAVVARNRVTLYGVGIGEIEVRLLHASQT